jgi:putative Mg2+ transporter-C (MgtC) family protein
LRRDNIVIGVTTAATLWYVTVIGLCFGGGQVLLGWAATALGCLVLWVMDWFEASMARVRHARLAITVEAESPNENQLRARLARGAIEIRDASLVMEGGRRTYTFNVRELRSAADATIPPVVAELGRAPGVSALKWVIWCEALHRRRDPVAARLVRPSMECGRRQRRAPRPVWPSGPKLGPS